MRNYAIIFMLLGLALTTSVAENTTPNDQSDYWNYWDCDGTTNPIVQNSRFEFTYPPQVDVHSKVTLFLTPNQNFYCSQLTLSVKVLGVQVYKFTEDVNTEWKAGQEGSRLMWIPTEQ